MHRIDSLADMLEGCSPYGCWKCAMRGQESCAEKLHAEAAYTMRAMQKEIEELRSALYVGKHERRNDLDGTGSENTATGEGNAKMEAVRAAGL